MFRLFAALMPKDTVFVDLFTHHAETIVSATRVFENDLKTPSPDTKAALREIEHTADTWKQKVNTLVNQSFITPFDKADILDLITSMDAIVNKTKDVHRRIRLYNLPIPAEIPQMCLHTATCALHIHALMPMLSNLSQNADGIRALCAEIHAEESRVDRLRESGLAAAFSDTAPQDHALRLERLFDEVELISDICEDVAEILERILVKMV